MNSRLSVQKQQTDHQLSFDLGGWSAVYLLVPGLVAGFVLLPLIPMALAMAIATGLQGWHQGWDAAALAWLSLSLCLLSLPLLALLGFHRSYRNNQAKRRRIEATREQLRWSGPGGNSMSTSWNNLSLSAVEIEGFCVDLETYDVVAGRTPPHVGQLRVVTPGIEEHTLVHSPDTASLEKIAEALAEFYSVDVLEGRVKAAYVPSMD